MKQRCLKPWMAALICLSVVLVGGLDRQTLDAMKVRHILRKIAMHPARAGQKALRETISQAEANAYLGRRLEREGPPGIHGLRLTLLDRDHLKGKVKIDAVQLNLGRLFGATWDVAFAGVLETRNGQGRIDLSSLRINGRPVAPELLDVLIRAADAINGTSTGGLEDWYPLPKGVQRIRLTRGRASLQY